MKKRGLGGRGDWSRQRAGTTQVRGTVTENLSRGFVCCLICPMDLQKNKEPNRFKTDILYRGRNQISVSYPLAKSDVFKLFKTYVITDLDLGRKKITRAVTAASSAAAYGWVHLGSSRVSGTTG